MTYDVVVPVLLYPDAPRAEHILETAAFANVLGGSAEVLLVEMVLPRLEGHWGTRIAGVAGMVGELEKRQHAAQENLRPQLAAACQVTSLKLPQAEVAQALTQSARTHDLAVVSTETVEGRELAQQLIFGSGRPVVIVPPGRTGSSVRHVAIAWDGSRAAARAVHDAMPWIASAGQVTIIAASEDKNIATQSLSGLKDYFGRKGVKSDIASVAAHGRGIGKTLQDEAINLGADMLVMGAFGHSRLRDFILGGATAGVFEETRLPVFLSH